MDVKYVPYSVDTQCEAISNFENLEALITLTKATLPDVRITLTGSSLNGFGLKTGKVDMDQSPVGNGDALEPRVQTLGVAFLFWVKICGLYQQKKYTLPAHAFAVITVFFLQQCKAVVLPVLHEVKVCDEFEPYVKPKDLEGRWAFKNYRSVGQWWVELLRFYAVELKLNKHVVFIRKSQPILIAEKWNKRYIAIEDRYSSKWNMARSIPSEQVCLFLKGCQRWSVVNFLLPKLRSGPMFTMTSLSLARKRTLKGKKEWQRQPPELSVLTRENNGDDGDEERGDGAKDNDEDKYLSFDENVVSNPTPFRTRPQKPKKFVKPEPGPAIPQRILDDLDLCSVGYFQYSFTGILSPAERCHRCGHRREDCPDQRLPEWKRLPEMTRTFTKILNDVCQDVINACPQQPQEEADRQDLLHKPQLLIRESHKNAKLTLYGSSYDGFGLARSKDGKDISHVRMMKYLARKFYKHPELDEVIAITNAKVPIVKLFHVPSGLKADFSFLSSYGYILMALYYLQQRKPPLIPVLQELNQSEFGHNESVGELWLCILWFYTKDFNFKETRIVHPSEGPLTKLQKMWNIRCIAIEDPFDFTTISLTHGQRPNDGGCHRCDKIGHHINECSKDWPPRQRVRATADSRH
ncbi:hypothetical protein HPB48_025821 [Haemaphysalis longicornis]|uniref:CCHC-type domain-containing protein n=1 Tax=Haemaphysalis longicornis TaxID=44386 RepID=A0A9J6GZP4_HAELO|nr:hypothetical protein HPB48_025821 [Haemaphysalis longicornis]